jgi:hypothetical protein
MKPTPYGRKAKVLIKNLEKLSREWLRMTYEPLYKTQNNKSLAATRLYNPTKDED